MNDLTSHDLLSFVQTLDTCDVFKKNPLSSVLGIPTKGRKLYLKMEFQINLSYVFTNRMC